MTNKKLEKEDKYIEKLTDKLSEKINKNNGELLTIYNNDKKSILNFVKNVYKKYKHASLYKPRNNDIEEIPLESIMNSSFKIFLALVRGYIIICSKNKCFFKTSYYSSNKQKNKFTNVRRFGQQTFISCPLKKIYKLNTMWLLHQ